MAFAGELTEYADDARVFCALYGLEPGCCLVELCERATGSPPIFERSGAHGRYADGLVYLSTAWSERRQRSDFAHELGHCAQEKLGVRGVDPEAYAWFVGSCLLMPEDDFRRSIRRLGGHSYRKLAAEYECEEAMAVGRISEVTGRPSLILREHGEPIVRGREYAWPSPSALVRLASTHRSEVHYVKIFDDPTKHAFFVERAAWLAMSA